jgi:hypothetical protein
MSLARDFILGKCADMRMMTTYTRGAGLALIVPFAALLCVPPAACASTLLGSAVNFAVLGGSTVTNTDATTINGDLGVNPGTSITGLTTVTLNGTVHDDDAGAQQAESDATAAFGTLADMSSTTNLSGQDLGVVGELTPGVYTFNSSAQLTGTLTLDFAGHADQPFVFQIGTSLTTAAAADIIVLNGGPHSAIYWEVGSSATLGAGTAFAGNILADQSITLDTGAAVVCGRAIALNAAVTMDGATLSNNCAGQGDYGTGRGDFGSYGFSGGSVPEPAAWAMMILGLVSIGAAFRRRAHGEAAAIGGAD